MPIPFRCPHCGVTGSSQEKHIGRTVACPKCGQDVRIIAPETAATVIDSPPAPPAMPFIVTAQSVPTSKSCDDRKRRIPRRLWPPLTILLGILLPIVGIAFQLFLGYGMLYEYTLLGIFCIGILIVLVAPASLAYWQVRTPQRGLVPPHHVASMLEWSVLIIASLLFLASVHEDTAGIPWTNRLSLIAALWAIMSKIARRTFKRRTWLGLVPLILLIVFVWSRYDYREHFWTNENEPKSEHWYYTDYTYRGQDHPYFRTMHCFGGKNDRYFNKSMSGTFSDSGKLHGQWKTTIWRKVDGANSDDGDFDESEQWYWYGEPITEGEWHLRNK